MTLHSSSNTIEPLVNGSSFRRTPLQCDYVTADKLHLNTSAVHLIDGCLPIQNNALLLYQTWVWKMLEFVCVVLPFIPHRKPWFQALTIIHQCESVSDVVLDIASDYEYFFFFFVLNRCTILSSGRTRLLRSTRQPHCFEICSKYAM